MATGTQSMFKAEIVQAEQFDQTSRIVNTTASTLTVTKLSHDNKTVTINAAAGCAVTLPAATGIGSVYKFIIGTTITSNTTTFTRAGSDTMSGRAFMSSDNAADAAISFEATAASVLTLNGTTKGGLIGDWIEFTDYASGKWLVRAELTGNGSEVTVFS